MADPNYSTYLRTTRIDKDLSARAVKSYLLLEEKRIDVAAELSERDSTMATRRQWKSKQQYKDDRETKGQRPTRPKVLQMWKNETHFVPMLRGERR